MCLFDMCHSEGLYMAMQDSWQVLQHWQHDTAGPQPETAVIAALSFWDYSLVANVQGSDTYKATGRCFSVAAGRISYSYGLKGWLPCDSQPCDACVPSVSA